MGVAWWWTSNPVSRYLIEWPIFPFFSYRYCPDRSIVGHGTLGGQRWRQQPWQQLIQRFFLMVSAGRRTGTFYYVSGTDVEMCKSFNLKTTLYDSSTVSQIAERFEPNTILRHSTQYSHLVCFLNFVRNFSVCCFSCGRLSWLPAHQLSAHAKHFLQRAAMLALQALY